MTDTITAAERISALLDGDGHVWEAEDGTALYELIEREGGRRERVWMGPSVEEATAMYGLDLHCYRLADGSRVLMTPGGWMTDRDVTEGLGYRIWTLDEYDAAIAELGVARGVRRYDIYDRDDRVYTAGQPRSHGGYTTVEAWRMIECMRAGL